MTREELRRKVRSAITPVVEISGAIVDRAGEMQTMKYVASVTYAKSAEVVVSIRDEMIVDQAEMEEAVKTALVESMADDLADELFDQGLEN